MSLLEKVLLYAFVGNNFVTLDLALSFAYNVTFNFSISFALFGNRVYIKHLVCVLVRVLRCQVL